MALTQAHGAELPEAKPNGLLTCRLLGTSGKTRRFFGRLGELRLIMGLLTSFHVSRLNKCFGLALRLERTKTTSVLDVPEGHKKARPSRTVLSDSSENHGSFPAGFCNPTRQ